MSSEPTAGKRVDPLIGVNLGGEYLVTELLGEGGMGSVYLAKQGLTERVVAVKVLQRQLYEPVLFERFKQEAQIVSKLSHPNIITIYTYGQHTDGTLFIAMEYVRGFPLSDLVEERGGWDVERALPLMIQMVDALAYAHDLKIIHRDIKPANMIVTRTGRSESVKLLDFGIAKMLDGNAQLTRTGMVTGSPLYMSPEQWETVRDMDGRTDIYSLGCVFYEMMTGRPLYEEDSPIGYMYAHTSKTPPHVADHSNTISQLPVLGDIIMRCIARHRNDRYADAYALLDALKEADSQFSAQRRGLQEGISTAPKAATPVAARTNAPRPPNRDGATVARPRPMPEPVSTALADTGSISVNISSIPSAPVDPQPASASQQIALRTPREATGSFQAQAPAAPPDRVHVILSAVGAVMLTILAIAVFTTH